MASEILRVVEGLRTLRAVCGTASQVQELQPYLGAVAEAVRLLEHLEAEQSEAADRMVAADIEGAPDWSLEDRIDVYRSWADTERRMGLVQLLDDLAADRKAEAATEAEDAPWARSPRYW